MILTEILPAVRELSESDKKRLAELLLTELSNNEKELRKHFKPGAVHAVFSPFDEVEAARSLQLVLDRQGRQYL